MSKEVDLSKYNNEWYNPGNPVKRSLWFLFNAFFLLNPMNPFNGLRKFVLRLFGAKLGKGVVIKPRVNVKYPWKLTVGEYSWIGESVWIDNLAPVNIGPNVCLSQGAMLLCGNHNYKKITFDLMVEPITIEKGGWIGAYAVVCPGVTCRSHAILTVGSIVSSDMEEFGIYSGNPAVRIKDRVIHED